jgi:DNA-binding transcriptional ArsR family regulator
MGDPNLSNLEEFFLALSDGTRLRLLSLMRKGETSVGYLSDEIHQSQPKVSRHLAYLRSAGLVETRRDGKWVYYTISRSKSGFARDALNSALDWVAHVTGKDGGPASAGELRYEQVPDVSSAAAVGESKYCNDIEIYLL